MPEALGNCSKMRLLGLLPFLVLLGVAITLKQAGYAKSIRESLAAAGVNTAAWAVAGAELLSLFQGLAFWPLLIWWGVPAGVLGWLCWRGWKAREDARPAETRLGLPELPGDPVVLIAWAIIGLLLLLSLVAGLLVVPSNWDVVTYHLPRQVYWMQQQHVGLFSTGDSRMLSMPPLAEYI